MKLNDFLSNMLKSKQSRLTKKMKNAKLSAKQYKRTASFIMGEVEAREISQLETNLFASIRCRMERSELRFHMQKVWRGLFSQFCSNIGQKLELEGWLRSVEEMERRTSQALDAARRARRKAMIGYALTEDTKNVQSGVLIDPNLLVDRSSHVVFDQNGEYAEMGSETDSVGGNTSNKRPRHGINSGSARARAKSTSFVARVMHFVQLRRMIFEHVDVWVPSAGENVLGCNSQVQKRLAFGGCATADTKVPTTGAMPTPLTAKDQYDLVSFGEYSQRFSFDIGSGLPGRVFSSGVPSWEQGLKSAPPSLFARAGGARQWGVETALGIPVNSPSVGRIVVVLYSMHDRSRDQEMVSRLTEELSRLLPMPRWKLVVEVGADVPVEDSSTPSPYRETDLKSLLQSLMNGNPSISQQITGLTSLCHLLDKENLSCIETELLQDALQNYENYKRQGRADTEVAWLTCRDFVLNESSEQKQNKCMNKCSGAYSGSQAPACFDAGLAPAAVVPASPRCCSSEPSSGCGASAPSNGCGASAPSNGCGASAPSNGCGASAPSNGCGASAPSNGCGASAQLNGCCASAQSNGCGASAQLNGCGASAQSNGCGASSQLNGCGAFAQSNGCSASAQSNGCGASAQLNGCSASAQLNGCGASAQSNGCGASAQSNGCGASAQSNGCGASAQSNGCCPTVKTVSGCCPPPAPAASTSCVKSSTTCCAQITSCPPQQKSCGFQQVGNSCSATSNNMSAPQQKSCGFQQPGNSCTATSNNMTDSVITNSFIQDKSLSEGFGPHALEDTAGVVDPGGDVAVLDTLALPTAMTDLQQDGPSLFSPEDTADLDHNGAITGSLDLGVTAVQLAQLFTE